MLDLMDESLARLVGDLADADSLTATIEQIVAFAQTTLGAEHAGVTMILPRKAGLETLGQTDQLVWERDTLQHELHEGPCVDTAVEGRALRSGDLGCEERWPRWGPAAAAAGLHSILSIELHARGKRMGALNLYGDHLKQFDEEDAALARMFAFHAGSALAVIRNEEGLRQALDTRSEIGQAQGILMERFGIDATQSFNVLRRDSQDSQVKVVDVARALIARRDLPLGRESQRHV